MEAMPYQQDIDNLDVVLSDDVLVILDTRALRGVGRARGVAADDLGHRRRAIERDPGLHDQDNQVSIVFVRAKAATYGAVHEGAVRAIGDLVESEANIVEPGAQYLVCEDDCTSTTRTWSSREVG